MLAQHAMNMGATAFIVAVTMPDGSGRVQHGCLKSDGQGHINLDQLYENIKTEGLKGWFQDKTIRAQD